MAKVNFGARFILSALMVAFLFFMPCFIGCNDTPATPVEPAAPTYNTEAKEELAKFYDHDFFPFDLATVLELDDKTESSFSFTFSCENIVAIKTKVAENLYPFGFTQKADENFNMFTETEGMTINFKIVTNENNFSFIAIKEEMTVVPDEKSELEQDISSLLGIDFSLGEFIDSVSEVSKTENRIKFLIRGKSFSEVCKVVRSNFVGTNFRLYQDSYTLTITLKTPTRITLLLANGDGSFSFSLKKS